MTEPPGRAGPDPTDPDPADLAADDSADDELLAQLGVAVRAGREVPATFVAAGKAAFSWRTVDVELAALVADSDRSAAAGAGLRAAPADDRWLTFAADRLTVEVELRGDVLHGQLVPPGPGSVSLQLQLQGQDRARSGSGSGRPPADGAAARAPAGRETLARETVADEVGYFTFRPLRPGLVRLRIVPDGGAPVVTGWFRA